MKITVRVPASTSNLGPGYDALGMALSLTATFTFEPSDILVVDGCPEAYRNADNLVIQGFRKVYEKVGKAVPPVHLTIESDVPVARGLGSSSTCIAGGMAAANAMLGNPLTMDDLFQLCTIFEGHPDNAAPAFFGGLTASFMHDNKAVAVPFTPNPDWRFVAIIPDYEVRTEEARRIVPKEISLAAGVHTMSHAIAMIRGLETGDEALVGKACVDQLHEPYRRQLIAEYDILRDMALEAGAATFFISGSGSTLIAVTRSENVAQNIVDTVGKHYPHFITKILTVCHEGTTVSVEP